MPIMHNFICTLKIIRLVILMWKMKPAKNKCINLYISSRNSTIVKEYDFHILIYYYCFHFCVPEKESLSPANITLIFF